MKEPIKPGTIVLFEGSEYRFVSYWDRETAIIEDYYTLIPRHAQIECVIPIDQSFTKIK